MRTCSSAPSTFTSHPGGGYLRRSRAVATAWYRHPAPVRQGTIAVAKRVHDRTPGARFNILRAAYSSLSAGVCNGGTDGLAMIHLRRRQAFGGVHCRGVTASLRCNTYQRGGDMQGGDAKCNNWGNQSLRATGPGNVQEECRGRPAYLGRELQVQGLQGVARLVIVGVAEIRGIRQHDGPVALIPEERMVGAA